MISELSSVPGGAGRAGAAVPSKGTGLWRYGPRPDTRPSRAQGSERLTWRREGGLYRERRERGVGELQTQGGVQRGRDPEGDMVREEGQKGYRADAP